MSEEMEQTRELPDMPRSVEPKELLVAREAASRAFDEAKFRLTDLRAQRDRINDEIRELVAATELLRRMVKVVDHE